MNSLNLIKLLNRFKQAAEYTVHFTRLIKETKTKGDIKNNVK